MDILEALAQHKELESKPSQEEQDTDFATIHPSIFANLLQKCGLDQETIDDCLFEPRTRWDALLEYFENR